MIQYNRIEAALASLADSTDRSIALRNETFTFSGLNSPYVSHQSCVMSQGHHVPGTAVFSNGRYTLVVTWKNSWVGFDPALPTFDEPNSPHWRALPAHMVQPLLKFPATAPEWLRDGRVLFVMVPDFFSHLDGEGKPVFRPTCRITATFSDGQGNESLRVLVEEDNSEAVDSASGLRLYNGRIWQGGKNGSPLSQERVVNVGKVEPSDEFAELIPQTLGEFIQCKTGHKCPDEKGEWRECPDSCPGKTENWHWRDASAEED